MGRSRIGYCLRLGRIRKSAAAGFLGTPSRARQTGVNKSMHVLWGAVWAHRLEYTGCALALRTESISADKLRSLPKKAFAAGGQAAARSRGNESITHTAASGTVCS